MAIPRAGRTKTGGDSIGVQQLSYLVEARNTVDIRGRN